MSFGFGVGDFFALANLTLNLYRSFKDAPGEFAEISREFQSFYIVVVDLTDQATNPNSPLNQQGQMRRSELFTLRDNLISTMEQLQDLYQRYQQMGKLSWSRFTFGQEDLSTLRSKLTTQLLLVNTFVASISLAAQETMSLHLRKMDFKLERILNLLNKQARGSVDQVQTVLSAALEDDTASWVRLETNLMEGGITMEDIQENRERIKEVLASVVEMNILEEIDGETIYPDESISQVGYVTDETVGSGVRKYVTDNEERSTSINPQTSRSPNNRNHGLQPENHLPPVLLKAVKSQPRLSQQKVFREHTRPTLASPSNSITYLSESGDFSRKSTLKSKIMLWATSNSQEKPLKLLLQRGCDPSTIDGECPLVIFAAKTKNWDIVRLLVDSGADINAGLVSEFNDHLYTGNKLGKLGQVNYSGLLHYAVEASQYGLMKILLKNGIIPDMRFDIGGRHICTALHMAADNYDHKAVEILLNHGAGVNIKSVTSSPDHGDNPLVYMLNGPKTRELAINFFNPDRDKQDQDKQASAGLKTIQLLIKNGIDVNYQNEFGHSALHLAVKFQLRSYVALLLSGGADPNAFEQDETVLYRACSQQDIEVARLLLSKGAKVDAPYNILNPRTGNILHMAAGAGYYDIVELLLENGADPSLYAPFQGTARDYALKNKYRDVSKLLRRYERLQEIT